MAAYEALIHLRWNLLLQVPVLYDGNDHIMVAAENFNLQGEGRVMTADKLGEKSPHEPM